MILEAIDDFLIMGQQAGWSGSTIKQYRWHLERCAAWLAERDVTTTDRITARLVRSYGASLAGAWQAATCKVSVVAMRSFFTWAADLELCDIGLDKALRTPRVPERIQRTVQPEEVETLLDICSKPYQVGGLSAHKGALANIRNRALVALLYDSLLRANELCGLRVVDVDLAKKTAFVRRGKGGASGIAYFSEPTAQLLAEWLEIRPHVAAPGCDALFVGVTGSTPGQGITPPGLRAITRNLARRAGVRHVSPHAFRRGGACEMVANGAGTRIVMAAGRWKRLSMVETYTRALDAGGLHEQYAPMTGLARTDDDLATASAS